MTIPYGLLADILVCIHFLYVAFVVAGEAVILIGGPLKWGWIRSMTFRMLHLAAIGIVALQAILGKACPLTVWEYRLRIAAGQYADQEMTFVGRLFQTIIYYDFPAWFFTFLYIGFALLVMVTLVLFPPRRRKQR